MKRRQFIKGVGIATSGLLVPEALHATEGINQQAEKGIHVRFLGTGAADWNGRDDRGELRRFSSVLVDGKILIDFTAKSEDMLPEGCRPEVIFYTHSHGDHYDPAAALRAGVKRVYLSQTWYDIASSEFQRAAREANLPMPELVPLGIGQHVEVEGITFTPLPANHASFHLLEQTLIYLLEKEGVRLLYATDTGGITATASRLAGFDTPRGGKALTAIIMEATMGLGHEVDYRIFSHSSVATVVQTVQALTMTGHYTPPSGQPVYITHLARTLHGTQAELDRDLPSPIRAAYDGLEVRFA